MPSILNEALEWLDRAEQASNCRQKARPNAERGAPTPEVVEAVAAVKRYFEGEETDFSTLFALRVGREWRTVRGPTAADLFVVKFPAAAVPLIFVG